MHKLIIEDDEGRTTVVPLVRDELTIGRKEGNTIRLTERNVSRRHARLFKQNGAICVEDLSSYTGVRVNGVRILAATAVRDGDQVQIGDYKLALRSEGAADVLPATVPGLPAGLTEPAPATGPTAHQAPGDTQQVAAPGEQDPQQARPVVPAHMDASPTIPLRTLEEQGRAPKLPHAQPGRLVVVSTELAGMEFRLDRPSLVMGRTEENDIILNHASISRHHAKVVRDGDRYTVVDLQSANGVRVAGESYERVDVQPGDIVELGHVKMRFVGPWEDWTFDPREFQPKSRQKLKIGAGIGGIVLAGILIFSLQGKKSPPAAPPTVLAAPVPAGPTPAELLAGATKAAADENWDKAVSALDLLLGHPAGDAAATAVKPQAADLKRRVDLERRSAEIFASFEQAVSLNEPDVALSRFDEIPTDSVYKKRAEPALDGVKTLFVSVHLDLADSERTQGRCDEARAEAEKIQQVDPENRRAGDIVKKCRGRTGARVAAVPVGPGASPTVAAAAAPTASRPTVAAPALPRPGVTAATALAASAHPATAAAARPAAAAPTVPARPPAARLAAPRTARQTSAGQPSTAGSRTVASTSPQPTAPSADPDEFQPPADAGDLIKQAREAWMHQECGAATDLSRRALKLKPGSNDAHQIIAVCACTTKDKDGALKSYVKLDERSRAMVRTLCARNGVELSP